MRDPTSENDGYCADCGKEFHEFEHRIIHASSSLHGVYYSGAEICDGCKEDRFQEHIIIHEKE